MNNIEMFWYNFDDEIFGYCDYRYTHCPYDGFDSIDCHDCEHWNNQSDYIGEFYYP